MSGASRVFKKVFIGIAAFVFLLVAAAIIIPLVVDVDQYRPQIVEQVNQRINGKFDLGKLKLSLWGQVRVDVGGLKLTDAKGRSVVKVEDVYFHLPFASLLSGAPVLTFKMKKPELAAVKGKDGKLNVLTLVKTAQAPSSAAAAPAQGAAAPSGPSASGANTPVAPGAPGSSTATAPSQPTSPPPAAPAAPVVSSGFKLPGIVAKARLGVEIRDASLTYQDEALGKKPQQVKDLNLVIRDLSLTRTMDLELWAEIESKVEQQKSALQVSGPFKVTAQAEPRLSDAKLESLRLSFKADFDPIVISMLPLFEKKKGIPAHATGVLSTSFDEAQVESFEAVFHNAELKATGKVTQLGGMGVKQGVGPMAPNLQIKIKSNEIAFKPWSELVPMLKAYELGGSATLEAEASGEASKLNYLADLRFNKVTAKAPHLKAQPEINGQVHVVTDRVDKMLVTLKAPGNDLKVDGKLTSFTAPRLEMLVTSAGMDLDQLIEFPPLKKAEHQPGGLLRSAFAEDKSQSAAKGSAGAAVPVTDFDALLEPLRSVKMLSAMVAGIHVNLAFVKAYGVKISDIVSKMTMKDLVAAIDSFSMNVFGGSIKGAAGVDLKPKAPQYRFTADVNALDLKQAVSSQLPLFKNTLLGKAFFKISGTGASLNPESAKKNLNAKGSLKVEKATFATIDVGKMTSEALNQTLSKLAEKIPQLKGKTLGGTPGRESRYAFISSDFTLVNGRFSAPNFVAKAEPKQGVDLKGETHVGIADFSLKTAWEVMDTHNVTHARDLSVEHSGVKVDHVLAEGDKPVRFPVNVNCTLMAPCYSYTEVPEFLGKIALNNVTHAVEGRAKAELRKRAEEQARKLTEKAPPAVKNKVEDIRKKLFGK